MKSGGPDLSLRDVLDRLVKRGEPEPDREIDDFIGVLIDVCRRIEEEHARGELCHVLAPEEVWLEGGRSGRIKLRLMDDAEVAPSLPPRAIRALGYLAPEVLLEGRGSHKAADLFSLGAVLYEGLTGQRAFPGETALQVKLATLECKPRPPHELRGRGVALLPLCMRLLARAPEQRPEGAGEVTRELVSWLARAAETPAPSGRDTAEESALRVAEEREPPALRSRPLETYELGEELGRGGLGRVLRAQDRELRRVVAVKVLARVTEQGPARFLREVLLTARLQHPSIVPIYDAGVWPSGEPFYAMKLVSGRSLAAVLAETKTLEKRLALLPSMIDVAEAIAYAHAQRVIHRDLKPQNVLIGEFGETVVIDWGLAKDLTAPEPEREGDAGGSADAERGPDLTRTDAVLGTPGYMPPEQAERSREVDERADVYALGALLYHLLAGSPPYGTGEPDMVLRALLSGPPPPLARRAPEAPRDLFTLVEKAMARDPAARYATARELCDDLKKFQTGQLVGAHRYTLQELLGRWLRRRRGVVGVSLLALLVLATVGAVSVARIVRAERAATQAERAATTRADELALISARELSERDPRRALEVLLTMSQGAKEWSAARTITADLLSRRRPEILRGYTPSHALPDLSIALSPDGRTLAFGREDSGIELVDLDSGQRRTLPAHERWIYMLVFSPDGRSLGSFSGDEVIPGAARLWDLGCLAANGGKEPCQERRLVKSEKEGFGVGFSPDGRWFAAAGPDTTVELFDRHRGQAIALPRHSSAVFHLAFSRDSETLVTASLDGSIRLFRDLERGSGADVQVLPGHQGVTYHIAISSDGEMFASTGSDATVKLWSVRTGALIRTLSNDQGMMWFSRDGARLAFGSTLSMRVLTVATGDTQSFGTDETQPDWAEFSPDGRTLAYAAGPAVHLVELASGRRQVLYGHEDRVLWLRFSSNGKGLLSAGYDGAVRRWTLPIQPHERIQSQADADPVFSFSVPGRLLAYTGKEHIRTRSLVTGAERDVPGALGVINSLALSPDGDWLAVGGKDGAVSLVDLARGEVRALLRHDDEVYQVLFSPDGRYVASCAHVKLRGAADHMTVASSGRDKTVRVFDRERGEPHVFSGSARPVRDIAFSSDGSALASASIDGSLRVIDLSRMEERVLASEADFLADVELSPDGRTLAIFGRTGIFLVDRQTGAKRPLVGHQSYAHAIAFSPDGKTLASGGNDSLAILWDVETGAAKRTLRGHRGPVRALAFSSDGRQLATAAYDGLVLLWELETFESRWLQGHEGVVVGVGFAPDGSAIIAAGDDGSLRLWKDDLPYRPEELRPILSEARRSFDAPRTSP
jgi:WD40 repeat protein/serine/threonine protein kinase